MSKYFVDQSQINSDTISINNLNDIKHITKVLRLGIGDILIISDSMNFDYEVEINKIMSTKIECKILDKQRFSKEPNIKITLFQGIPKQTKMELIVQKNVELGVCEIVPVFMDRTIVVDRGNFSKKIDRWNKISQEASGQCKRGVIPEVKSDIKFDDMLKYMDGFDLVVFPYENQENFTIKDLLKEFKHQLILKDQDDNFKNKLDTIEDNRTNKDDLSVVKLNSPGIAVIIGPEGGFSNEEVSKLENLDIKPVSLGKTILRTETAGFATVSMIMYELEL